ncbi:MAG: rhodanese-like domain-containing protein [Anaerolineales bacterium]|uniref:Rhodanese-like domain-containing protein n=1 Tax=Candidatus Desulfolinea nitratireducens TaxID=2841698 RepID=A0A8J6NID5_9CHLR|nr:rhodanese-like domain-containing protein [Candidatus Desulfolinea nitratireducens]
MTKKQKKALRKKAKNNQQQLWIVLAIVTIAIIAIFIATQSPTTPATINALPAEINTGLAFEKYEEGAFLLDVRTPEEWAEYHVPGATLITLDQLEARVSEVPFDQEVIIICRSGNRSQVGRDILLAAGHRSVTSIAGGIKGWDAAGHPTVTGE